MAKRNEFNAHKAQILKDDGIERVKVRNMQWVMKARAVAIKEAKRKGWVTSDDVQKICPRPLRERTYEGQHLLAQTGYGPRALSSLTAYQHTAAG